MNPPNSSRLSLQLILILGAIAALTPLAIDMYLPGNANVAKDFSSFSQFSTGYINRLYHWVLH